MWGSLYKWARELQLELKSQNCKGKQENVNQVKKKERQVKETSFKVKPGLRDKKLMIQKKGNKTKTESKDSDNVKPVPLPDWATAFLNGPRKSLPTEFSEEVSGRGKDLEVLSLEVFPLMNVCDSLYNTVFSLTIPVMLENNEEKLLRQQEKTNIKDDDREADDKEETENGDLESFPMFTPGLKYAALKDDRGNRLTLDPPSVRSFWGPDSKTK